MERREPGKEASPNIAVAGCGHLRRPSSQPAVNQQSLVARFQSGTEKGLGTDRYWPVRQQPERYAHSGCVPRCPAPRRGPGLRFGALEAVVGVHFRIDGWGFERGSCPTSSPPCGAPGYGSVCAVPFREAGWGRRRRGIAPAPKSVGPSSRPAPRIRVTPGWPLRAGCTPALVGRGWRAGGGDQEGRPKPSRCSGSAALLR